MLQFYIPFLMMICLAVHVSAKSYWRSKESKLNSQDIVIETWWHSMFDNKRENLDNS